MILYQWRCNYIILCGSVVKVFIHVGGPSIGRVFFLSMHAYFSVMYNKILMTTDGSDSNKYAVDDGLKIAKAMDAEVTALCVFDIGSYANVAQGYGMGDEREYMIKSSEAALKYTMDKGKEMGVKITPKILTGRPADTIIEESKHYDLVICGSLGRTGISRALLGSVAEKVVRMAHCPVLVCRKQG
jgi:nucleotide-binding universal stress UspA family protein